MVTATRSRCYEPDASDEDFYDYRPAKRRRVQEKPVPSARASHASPSFDKCVDTANDLGTCVTQSAPTQLLTPTSSTPTPQSFRNTASSAPKDACERKRSSPQEGPASPGADGFSTPACDSIISSRASRPRRRDSRQHFGRSVEYQEEAPISVKTLKEHTTLEDSTTLNEDTILELNEVLSGTDSRSHTPAMEQSHDSTLPTNDAAGPPVVQHRFEILASASPTPTPPCTRPEFVYDLYNPDFGEEIRRAYMISDMGQSWRRNKYGAEVADVWKRGSTPEEARERWRVDAARQLAEAEEISDSD